MLPMVFPGKYIDKENLAIKLRYLINNEIVFIARHDSGDFMGVICGIISEALWYPKEYELTELFWWVTEKYRGSSAALRLLKEFISFGKKREDINRIIMSIETVSSINDNVYTKRGFTLKEKSFVMEV
jgi:RimJ/RimL family protein N-acetyltransferase